MKTCTRCKNTKPLDSFPFLKAGRFAPKCKACYTADALIWKENNLDRYREYHREYNKKNYPKNKEKLLEKVRKWKKENPEKRRADRKNQKAKRKLAHGKISGSRIKELLVLQKNKCPCCNLPLGNDYHIDHIIPLSKGGDNSDSNIQLLRKDCNLNKSAKDPLLYMREKGFLC